MADTECTNCWHRLRSDARFCTSCGTPTVAAGQASADVTAPSTTWPPSTAPPSEGPSPPGSPPPKGSRYTGPLLVAGAAATAAIAAAVVGFVVIHQSAPTSAPPTQSPTAPPPPTPYPSPDVSTPDVSTPTPSTADPASALQQEAGSDSATADSLVGAWIPQVSSKKVGLVADGITYDDAAIWADFQRSKAAHSDAILVRSDDYTSFRLPDYWVTVIAESFATANDANSWCSQNGYGVDDCYAKRLSHTDGPTGNTVQRG